MVSVQELYELWAGESDLDARLKQSLEPRGTEWLFDLFASLGPKQGELLLDVGTRDAGHAIRLVREHGLRAVAVDPLALHVERAQEAVAAAGLDLVVVEAGIDRLPVETASVDWVWCRDVLVHVDVPRGLAECARVLRPGARMVAYVTLRTELLEPKEAAMLVDAMALVPESLDPAHVEQSARAAGLAPARVERLGGEWRERMIEDGSWNASEALLELSRLERREPELIEEFGAGTVAAFRGGSIWGIYQLLGKLRPTVYVWERRG
jgi:ubiquinone/menaquinone biosynthesis C-methylase UbiE